MVWGFTQRATKLYSILATCQSSQQAALCPAMCVSDTDITAIYHSATGYILIIFHSEGKSGLVLLRYFTWSDHYPYIFPTDFLSVCHSLKDVMHSTFQSVYPPNGQLSASIGSWRVFYLSILHWPVVNSPGIKYKWSAIRVWTFVLALESI